MKACSHRGMVRCALLGLLLGVTAVSNAVTTNPTSSRAQPDPGPFAPGFTDTAAISRQHLTDWLGTTPTVDQLALLDQSLTGAIASNARGAADAANSVASVAWTLASTNPSTTLSLARISYAAASDDKVVAANPGAVAEAIVNLAGAMRLAERSAATRGVELGDTKELRDAILALANRPEILQAVPDIKQRMAEAIALADAQADLAGFVAAAGESPAITAASESLNLPAFGTATGRVRITPTDNGNEASPISR